MDSFATTRPCAILTKTQRSQHGLLLSPAMDCQPSSSGWFPSTNKCSPLCFSLQLKQPNVFPCSLVETSRLKRSATFSWTRFSRYFICIRSTVLLTNVDFQRYLWSPWYLCLWIFSDPTADGHKQVHNRWVRGGNKIQKQPIHVFQNNRMNQTSKVFLPQAGSDRTSSLFVGQT